MTQDITFQKQHISTYIQQDLEYFQTNQSLHSTKEHSTEKTVPNTSNKDNLDTKYNTTYNMSINGYAQSPQILRSVQ